MTHYTDIYTNITVPHYTDIYTNTTVPHYTDTFKHTTVTHYTDIQTYKFYNSDTQHKYSNTPHR